MKEFIFKFKRWIRFVVSIFASREFAFIYCLAGTIAQIAHTYFLTAEISSFTGGFKVFQATLISFFISSSLLYFVAVADSDDSKESRRNHLALNIFMIIEILINFYYYSRHLIIDVAQWKLFDFIFAILVSCLIPVTIKLYGNTIRAKAWIAEMDDIKKPEEINTTLLDAKIKELKFELEVSIHEWLNTNTKKSSIEDDVDTKEYIDKFFESYDGEIAKIFEKHQALFLNQFENKCKIFIKNQLDSKNLNQLEIEEAKIETSETK